MNLLELKTHIDSFVEDGFGNSSVLISLSEPSIGARAAIGVKDVHVGIDWEHEQIRIETDEPICRRGKSKDDILDIDIHKYSSPKQFYTCPICEEKVKKDSNYCSNCGQHLKFNESKKPVDEWKQKYK